MARHLGPMSARLLKSMFLPFLAAVLSFLVSSNVVHALDTTAGLYVTGRTASPADASFPHNTAYTLLVSQGNFGSYPPMTVEQNQPRKLSLPPTDNNHLCNDVTEPNKSVYGDSILLAPRGSCTFEQKAFNAQKLGATAIIIYGTLESRYTINTTALNETSPPREPTVDDIVFPINRHDYDCSKGRAMIPSSNIVLDDPLPYNAQQNDPLLRGPESLCYKNAPDDLESCPSQACLLTGAKSDDGKNMMEACCAWDLHIWLYNDVENFNGTEVQIPAVYVTMEQGRQLLRDMQSYQYLEVTLYARWRSTWNLSSLLIWALGVFVAAMASYLSAQDYRHMTQKALRRQARLAAGEDRNSNGDSQQQQRPSARQPSSHAGAGAESMELTAAHAVLFIVMASTSLLVLFYFKIYGVVKVMYAMGCSKAVSIIVFYPFTKRVVMHKGLGMRDYIVWRTGTEDFGDISLADAVSHVMGYSVGLVWLAIALTVRHPETVTFFWITQDIFGACMCILFLQVIKLNSMRVASILLMVAFFYDIFFVFISPLFFSKSVMMDVATSGGPPTADPLWCEKYPDDKNCQGGDPLPMLLTIPRLLDYLGGSSLLGLGDIVLPGLLLSFAARYDASKSLLGVLGGGNGNLNSSYACPERKLCYNCNLCSGGYFVPTVIAYAIGLFMANAAVYLMAMGQPALLYLVPCCLGTVLGMGYRRNEIKELWEGPKIIRAADAIVYPHEYQDANGSGDGVAGATNYLSSSTATHHVPLPQTDDEGIGLNVPTIPSARDDDENDTAGGDNKK